MQEADPKTPFSLTVATPPNSFSFLTLFVVCRCSSTVEHLICNQVVASSILAIGFGGIIALAGEVPEWTKGADCKSAGLCLRRFESFPLHQYNDGFGMGRAGIAQLVEREPSKLGVAGSSPVSRSSFLVNRIGQGVSSGEFLSILQVAGIG